ncbi:SlyX protein [Loktanella fryxellensis]|uniref:SlyX protein n=1 Tax=Loktanella fryxellensis TaxID=245187 RepID=A0A1H8D4Z6_9RHOB|nr:SlyX family protein [Loktanella fryxellensis]SEN02353.1 SlyX protein [Loktanella fryxellensis]
MTDTLHLEERIAHLTRVVEDLSDVIARQDRIIDSHARLLDMLMARDAARDAEAGGSIPLGDQRPPHW